MIPIAALFYERPECARACLDALRAVRGIGDCLLLPHVEPGCEEVRALVEAVDFMECRPVFNDRRLGFNANCFAAIEDAAATAERFAYVEDDILWAPDALEYLAFAWPALEADDRVFSAALYNRPTPGVEPDPGRVRSRSWFHPWGWGSARSRWLSVRHRLACALNDRRTLDSVLTEDVVRPGGLLELYPELSRSQNIGRRRSGQAYDPTLAAWYAANHTVTCWSGDPAAPPAPADFRLDKDTCP